YYTGTPSVCWCGCHWLPLTAHRIEEVIAMLHALRGGVSRAVAAPVRSASSSLLQVTENQQVRAFATEKKKKLTWRKLQRINEAKRNPDAKTRSQPPRAKIERQNSMINAVDDGKKWRVLSASVLERLPVIMPDAEDWEEDFENMQYELSLRHDQRLEDDFWFMEPGSKQVPPEEAPAPNAPEDPEEIVGAGFHLAPRETEDDKTDNRKSLNRALKGRVFLIVKNEEGSRYPWFFPVTEKQEGEKMRDAAVRELIDVAGEELEVYPVGNAPIGHLQFLHDEQDKSGFDGTKVFFYKSQLVSGDVALNNTKSQDYLWVTQKELSEYFAPEVAVYLTKMVPP
ncbi:TPA: hypothetical protein N0F65_010433, partial [Lagenidium giganteum]